MGRHVTHTMWLTHTAQTPHADEIHLEPRGAERRLCSTGCRQTADVPKASATHTAADLSRWRVCCEVPGSRYDKSSAREDTRASAEVRHRGSTYPGHHGVGRRSGLAVMGIGQPGSATVQQPGHLRSHTGATAPGFRTRPPLLLRRGPGPPENSVALQSLTRRFPNLTLRGLHDELEWVVSPRSRCLRELPVLLR